MANDPKDDDSFEDADFEDLDPIEDDDLGDDTLGDDSWEDEDSAVGDDDGTAPGEDGDAIETKGKKPKKERAPGEKTFVQKNFMLIVGAVVIVFGGVIGMSMMGGSKAPAPAAPENESADALPAANDNSGVTELTDNSGDMPPMPAPISAEQPAGNDGGLTPMPTPEQLQNTELAELDVDEIPATPAGKTTPQGEAPFNFEDEKQKELANEQAPVANPTDDRPMEPPADTQAPEPNQVMNAADRLNAEFRARAGTLPADGVAATGKAVDESPAPTLKDTREQTATPAPDLTPQIEEQKSQIADLQSRLDSQQADSQKAQQDLRDSLKSKDAQIADLQKSLADLKKQLDAAKADAKTAKDSARLAQAVKPAQAPEAEPVETAAAEPAPAPAPKPVVKHAKPEPANDMAPAPAPAKVVSWELKGAQPGKAILASKTTGDTRTVEVGDSIEGLGKITVIAKENGRWTVRGTKGQVVR